MADAHNVLLAAPNLADASTLSGGSWLAPLANMQTRPLKEVARASSNDLAATWWDVTLPRKSTIRALGLVNHNLTRAATIRVQAFHDEARLLLKWDSGWQRAWSRVWPSRSMDFRHPRWFSGVPADDELSGITPTWGRIIASVSATHWRWTIDDHLRPQGTVEIGRVVMARGWQPQFNLSFGGTISVEDRTEIEELEDGGEIAAERPRRRVVAISLEHLAEEEALGVLLDMQRTLGVWGEVLYCQDPTARRFGQALTMWCRYQMLQPITNASCIQYTNPIALIEIVKEAP